MDKETSDDTGSTSSSEGSKDKEDEQICESSGAQDQDGESYLCSNCGSRKRAHRCSGMSKRRAGRIPTQIGSPLAPTGQSPSPELLKKAETSGSLARQDVPLLDLHGKVEITEIELILPPQRTSRV